MYHLDKTERKEGESRNSNKKTIKTWMVERKNWGTKREIEEEEAAAKADRWRISNEERERGSEDRCLSVYFFTLYLIQALTIPRTSSFIVSPNLVSLFVFS